MTQNVSKLGVLFALAEQARTLVERQTLKYRGTSQAIFSGKLIRMIFGGCTRRSLQ